MSKSHDQNIPNTLLGVPREMQDEILYWIVVSNEQKPPKQPNLLKYTNPMKPSALRWGSNIFMPKDHNQDRTQAISTLLVNRHLHKETMYAFRRFGANKHYLDLLIINEKQIWKSWRYRPVVNKRINTLHLSFRVQGTCKYEESSFRTACEDSYPSNPPLISDFAGILRHFLTSKDVTNDVGERVQSPKSDRNLELDFVTPDPSL